MKRQVAISCVLIFVFVLILVGCAEQTYNVSFNTMGGTSIDSIIVTKEDTVEVPTVSKEGYTFNGWYTDSNYTNPYNFNQSVVNDITLYASWTINQYTITFDSMGGSVIAPMTADYNSVITAPTAPVKDGYTFDGWYTDNTYSTAFVFDVMPASDITVYAKWTVIQYTITYNLDGGVNLNNPDTYTIDSYTIILNPPTKEGHLFIGWFSDSLFTSELFGIVQGSTGNRTFYAMWVIQQYTLSFESNGGTLIDPITADYNSVITAPTAPVKDGYTFAGWYTDTSFSTAFVFDVMPASNTTIYAKWTLVQHTITYNLDGGVNSNNPDTYTVETSTISLQEPTKVGHTFEGWYDTSDFSTAPITTITQGSTSDITLYAKWTINQYTLSFDSAGGTVIDPITADYDTVLSAPNAPILEGYTFDGWYTDTTYSTAYVIDVMPAEDTTIYAKWTITLFTITYHLDGGINVSNPNTYTFETSTISLQEPTKVGHSFDGWYDTSDFSTAPITTILQGSTGDITLYAKWSVNSYSITYGYGTSTFDSNTSIELFPNETIIDLSLGVDRSSILTSTGRVFVWGNNDYGQLGDGTTVTQLSPVDITDQFPLQYNETIIAISLGESHSAALTSNGRLFTWGTNGFGQLGDGTTVYNTIPTDITDHFNLNLGEQLIAITMGDLHGSAISDAGRLFTWGLNYDGQLGNGSTTQSGFPIDITDNFNLNVGEKIVSTSLGYFHSAALTSDNRVFFWGSNWNGMIGDGTTTDTSLPIDITANFQLTPGEIVTNISVGNNGSAAITSLGRVFMWGSNGYSQLGDGTTTDQHLPLDITGQFAVDPGEGIIAIRLGSDHTLATTNQNRVFTWGNNSYGQLGDGTKTLHSTPLDITNHVVLYPGETISLFDTGNWHNAIVTDHNRVALWGENFFGEIGDNTTAHRRTPTYVPFYSTEIINIEIYDYNTSLSTPVTPERDGYTFAGWYRDITLNTPYIFDTMPAENLILYAKWTTNTYNITYELNGGSNGSNPSTYTVETATIQLQDPTKEGQTFSGWFETSDFTSGPITDITLGSTGHLILYAKWTINQYTVTYTTTTSQYDETSIVLEPGETIIDVTLGAQHSAALTSNGRVFTWGSNEFYQLGYSSGTLQNPPTDITHLFDLYPGETIVDIYLGFYHSAALSSEGRLFTWGHNNYGQCGDGTTTNVNTIIDITNHFALHSGEGIVMVSLGADFSSLVTTEGRVFTWGHNDVGQLGDDTIIDRNTPVDITSQFTLQGGEQVTMISLGHSHAAALTNNGRVFTWGSNYHGQLGLGTTDGVAHSSPTEMTSLMNLNPGETIRSIDLGSFFSGVITSDDRVLMWGRNFYGQLGDDTTINQSSAIDITDYLHLLTNETVLKLSLGNSHSSLLTSMGRLLMWGENAYMIGNGTQIDQYEPLCINAYFVFQLDESITDISLGNRHSSALTSNGRIMMWGNNFIGELGINTSSWLEVPTDIHVYYQDLYQEDTYDYNEPFTAPSEPTKEGYSFGGWYLDLPNTIPFTFTTMAAEDITLYSKWIPIDYTITYHLDGGINLSNPATFTIETSTILLQPAEKEGYSFGGWFLTNDFTGNHITTIDQGSIGNQVLYAKWIINDYSITYAMVTDDYNTTTSILLHPDETILEISLGEEHSVALTSEARVLIWGSNTNGQLGDGTTVNHYQPIDITDYFHLNVDETIIHVATGTDYTAALTSDGRVFMWGDNSHRQLGDGTYIERHSPTDITANFDLTTGETITTIVVGFNHSLAVTSEDRVFTWGLNSDGQLGDGILGVYFEPVDITSLLNLSVGEIVVDASLGLHHTAVVTSDNRVLMWGDNYYGQLGDGTTTDSSSPIDMTSYLGLQVGETILDIALGGNHSTLLTSDGRVLTWGHNHYNQLGIGNYDYDPHATPVDISDNINLDTGETIIHIYTGYRYSSILTSDARMLTWGENNVGQLGTGNTQTRSVPTDIMSGFTLDSGETIIDVVLGHSHSATLTSDDRVLIWGNNSKGQLGDGTTTTQYLPTDMQFYSPIINDVVVYEYATTVTEPTLDLYEGHTFSGWYHDIDLTIPYLFTTMPGENIVLYGTWYINQYTMSFDSNGGTAVADITADYAASIDAPIDPILEGYTFTGWYSDSTLTTPYVFDTMPAASITLYASWTLNQYTITYATVPSSYDSATSILLLPNETIESISLGGEHTGALTSENRVFMWGRNHKGQLGDGTQVDSLSPIDITDNFNLHPGETIVSIALGDAHSSAFTSEGRVFTWGQNYYRELGDGTYTTRIVPTDITWNFNLNVDETIVGVFVQQRHSLAITSDNRVFTWGENNTGQLGDGTTMQRATPFDITGFFTLHPGETFTTASIGLYHTSIQTSENRVFIWGGNNRGQLGDGTIIQANTPIEITNQFGLQTGETITTIALGAQHSAALTSDGRVFMWGQNYYGQLGNGEFNYVENPTPIDITDNFGLEVGETILSIDVGYYHSAAITSEGRLLTWGHNEGELGEGTSINRNLPTDITSNVTLDSGDTITQLSLGNTFSSIITNDGVMFIWGINTTGQLGDATTSTHYTPQRVPFFSPVLLFVETYDYNEQLTEPTDPTQTGYTFGGWYTDLDFTTPYTFTTMPAEDMVLYAKWIPTN